MKKIIVAVVVLLVVGAGAFFFFTSSPSQKPVSTAPQTIVAFGDSLVAGNGSTEGKDFVSDLSRKIGMTIINKGVSGETTEEGLKRVSDIIDIHPDIVLLLLGGNDAIQQKPVNETFSNLATIIAALQAQKIQVVLLGIQGGVIGDKYKDKFPELAKTYKTIFVPNVMQGIFGHEDLMSDQVHPNDKGYQMIADKVYPAIKPILNNQ